MINVLLPAILAFIFNCFCWIVDYNPYLKNKVMWFFLGWVTLTIIFGFCGLFFIPIY